MNDSEVDRPDAVLGNIVVDCADPERLATFWGELLGRGISSRTEPYVGLESGPRFGSNLYFQRVPEPRIGKNRLHLDITCGDIHRTAARVEALGGTRAEGYDDQRIIVMLDPEGNVFCLVPR